MKKRGDFSNAQNKSVQQENPIFNIDVLCINCNEMINVEEIGSILILKKNSFYYKRHPF